MVDRALQAAKRNWLEDRDDEGKENKYIALAFRSGDVDEIHFVTHQIWWLEDILEEDITYEELEELQDKVLDLFEYIRIWGADNILPYDLTVSSIFNIFSLLQTSSWLRDNDKKNIDLVDRIELSFLLIDNELDYMYKNTDMSEGDYFFFKEALKRVGQYHRTRKVTAPIMRTRSAIRDFSGDFPERRIAQAIFHLWTQRSRIELQRIVIRLAKAFSPNEEESILPGSWTDRRIQSKGFQKSLIRQLDIIAYYLHRKD